MPSYIYDVIIIAILALFVWRGASRGLILTLCGLAAAFVAFFGARFVSSMFCEPVAGLIRPVISSAITEALPDSVQNALDKWDEYLPAPSASPEVSAVPEASGAPEGAGPAGGGSGGTGTQTPVYTVEQVMDDIKDAGLFKGIWQFLKGAVDSGKVHQAPTQSPVDALADYIAKGFSRTVLFGLTYVAVVLGWFLLSHALDLAFKLPILSQINLIGGIVIGLAEAALIIIVVVWVCQALGWVPAEPESPLLKLFTIDNLWQLWEDLPA